MRPIIDSANYEDLPEDNIREIFHGNFYYQLRQPQEAEFIFIGLDANRPSYSKYGLVDSEREFLIDGVNWCNENKRLHPILSDAVPFSEHGKRYWLRAQQIFGTWENASRISMVELRRWPTINKGSCKIEELNTKDNRDHLVFLANLISGSRKKQFFVSPSVLDNALHPKLIEIFSDVFAKKEKVNEARIRRPHRIGDSNVHVIGHFSSRDSKEKIEETATYIQKLLY